MGDTDEHAKNLVRKLIDDAKLIKAGFAIFAATQLRPDAPAERVDELRVAFMAGAVHIWLGVAGIVEQSESIDKTERSRIDLIRRELTEWLKFAMTR